MAQLETFLDNFLIEEIPVEDAKSYGIVDKKGNELLVRTDKTERKAMYGKVLACAESFPRNGVLIQNPIQVGDIVMTSEFGRDPVTFTLEDEKPGAVKRYLIRFDDIRGRVPNA